MAALRNAHPGGGTKGTVRAPAMNPASPGQGSRQSVSPPRGRGSQSAGSITSTSPKAGNTGVANTTRSAPTTEGSSVGNSEQGVNGLPAAENMRRMDGDPVHPNRGANGHPY